MIRTLAALATLAAAVNALSMSMKFKVAVLGGGPSGACAAEALARNPNIECVMFERKMDNAKPCGGAIPVCMIEEFGLPMEIIDRKVRKMKLISPSNREVDIGQTLLPNEFIGMTRREVLDSYLRDRAVSLGATAVNALVTDIEVPTTSTGQYTIKYANFVGNTKEEMKVDYVIGADGANSRLAKAMGAGEYNYAIAFQERIKVSEEKMKFYEELAEMYVGDDVSPDFYGWVFPKYDHVGVGTGTVINRPAIKQYQKAMRDRAGSKIEGGKIIKVEAHPIPEHMRARRVVDRAALVGDAAGYVTKCSGEGIYFAAKSGRMAGEAVARVVAATGKLPTQAQMIQEYIKPYDNLYGPTYTVLDLLQRVFFMSNSAREAFVELCASDYVQRVTFNSYLYKKVQGNSPFQDIKLLFDTIGSLLRGNALSAPDAPFSNPVESLKRL
jgi:geranylgeranyl reductase